MVPQPLKPIAFSSRCSERPFCCLCPAEPNMVCEIVIPVFYLKHPSFLESQTYQCRIEFWFLSSDGRSHHSMQRGHLCDSCFSLELYERNMKMKSLQKKPNSILLQCPVGSSNINEVGPITPASVLVIAQSMRHFHRKKI